MRKLTILLPIFLCLISCTEKYSTLKEQLTSASDGWQIQQYTLYTYNLEYEPESPVWRHYKNCGMLFFDGDQSGNYQYDSLLVPFTWSYLEADDWMEESVIIEMDLDDVEDLNSPFIYHYMNTYEGTPLFYDPDFAIKQYEITSINSFTMLFRYNGYGDGYGYYSDFGSIEFLATKQ